MVEIIPNWHPIFVHFTVALFSAAAIFLIFSYLLANFSQTTSSWASEFSVVGRWNLWLAALITVGTALAGLYAYNTVKHDEISHAIMTIHRNWAIITVTLILTLAAWSLWNYYKQKRLSLAFVITLLMGQGLLLTTAWYGGELVYRYGTGVMSLPQEENSMHNHEIRLEDKAQKPAEHEHHLNVSEKR